jgi:hypothetical protein
MGSGWPSAGCKASERSTSQMALAAGPLAPKLGAANAFFGSTALAAGPLTPKSGGGECLISFR